MLHTHLSRSLKVISLCALASLGLACSSDHEQHNNVTPASADQQSSSSEAGDISTGRGVGTVPPTTHPR